MLITSLLACTAFACCFYFLGIGSALIHVRTRGKLQRDATLPPVTLLKPLKGLEEDLERCLLSFFAQQYPGPLEIVFAAATRDDPALRIARQLAERHPHVRARFVLTDAHWGLNPKVSNLQGALRAANTDLVLQTDANVWAPPTYVRDIVCELLREDGSLLSSLVTGIGESSLGAAVENLQLTAYVAPAVCCAWVIGRVPCVIGKSMLFRKSELRALGGLELVKDSLAEDFLIGQTYADAGKKVILSATPIRNVNVDMPLERSVQRHARWLKMRAVIHPLSFVADVLANPIALALLLCCASGLDSLYGWAALAIACTKTVIDGLMVRVIRGSWMPARFVLLVPFKDLLMLAVWFYASCSRSVVWRGTRFRLGPGSQLMPDEGNLPARVLRRLLET
ncbi:MAG: glycosyltransferase [Polyangiales bacterium]